MPSYRLYCLDGTGRITGAAELIEASDNEDAIAVARTLAKPSKCEIWLDRRLIATIPPAPPGT
jgi:hypothetical protein